MVSTSSTHLAFVGFMVLMASSLERLLRARARYTTPNCAAAPQHFYEVAGMIANPTLVCIMVTLFSDLGNSGRHQQRCCAARSPCLRQSSLPRRTIAPDKVVPGTSAGQTAALRSGASARKPDSRSDGVTSRCAHSGCGTLTPFLTLGNHSRRASKERPKSCPS